MASPAARVAGDQGTQTAAGTAGEEGNPAASAADTDERLLAHDPAAPKTREIVFVLIQSRDSRKTTQYCLILHKPGTLSASYLPFYFA